MKSHLRNSLTGAAWLALAACAGGSAQSGPGLTPRAGSAAAVSDDLVKVGAPYSVGGKTYTPEDVNDYDETGYASWYGEELEGEPTANGEIFVPGAISAAHKTLPLPSYVEVTALDTGRTILVRVNDRGPFANDRLIDLSRGAAEQLGIVEQGVAGVRVRRVFPPQDERALLRQGGQAAFRPETSEGVLTVLRQRADAMPKPALPERRAAAAVPAASQNPPSNSRSGRFIVEGERAGQDQAGQVSAAQRQDTLPRPSYSTGNNRVDIANIAFVIQVAAFSSQSRANTLAKQLSAAVVPNDDNSVWRVRYGPYTSATAAQDDLRRVRESGYPAAKILQTTR